MTTSPSTAAVRVLLVEDNPGDAGLIRAYLSGPEGAGFVLERVDRLGAALERLGQGDVELVLLDLSLPDSPTEETFARVRTAAPEVAVIVMSGLDDEARAIQTVQEGAQDYLVKSGLETRLLVRSMRYAMERKRVADALAEERELFRLLMDNIPERIFFKDAESRFTRVNRSLAGHFRAGHPRDLVGRRDADYFSAEHAEAARRDEEEVMRTGMPVLGKVERERLPDGSVTWALTSKLPLLSRRGQVTGTFGISRDITELKAIEEQLASERNLLRSLIDNLPDHIHAKDTEGRYLLNNEAHRRVLGASSEEAVVGRTVFDFFPAALARSLAADDALVMTSGRSIVNREERIVDGQGRERWHATTKVPLRTPEGRVRGMVCISRDITEARQAAEALQLANDELARHRADLQKALAALQRSHEDLKAAQFQLIQAEKLQSIGRLAAGVAHEVKNPLAILRMGLDYLSTRAAAGDENVAMVLSDMNEAIRRADAIILGLLDFAAPHALKLSPEDLGAVLEQSLGLVRHEVQAAGVQVVSELDAGLPAVRLDRNKMKQVFVNLLTNACHAMPAGGTLTLRTSVRTLAPEEVAHDAGSRQGERWHAGATVLMAEVLDTGSGIAEEKLSQVFDPFYTTKAAGQGTGLGLTVTRKIVELHGGAITIRNRKEGGVAVTILLKV